MAAGDIKIAYGASSALTQTNLDGLASSATWVGVWESDAIDNSSNLYTDYLINCEFQVESTGLSAGQIRVGIVAEESDTTWPGPFDGAEGYISSGLTTYQRDQLIKLGAVISTDTTASAYYNCAFSVAALFGGVCPRKFVVVVAQSTGTTLETTGDPNQVYVKGVYHTVAQA